MEPTPRSRATSPKSLREAAGWSTTQNERRQRIIDATIALASGGGYEAVQMRAVAERADVALGTLYRYFPSKIHLLIAGLTREFERLFKRLDTSENHGDTPPDRVIYVLSQVTKSLQRNPELTEAMTRAFMFADTSVSTEVDLFAGLVERMFTQAMSDEEPTEKEKATARVISDVWLANLVAWVTRRASGADVRNGLELTVRLLLR